VFEPYGVSVRTTNPVIKGSYAWDGAANLNHLPRIDELVSTTITDDGRDTNPYFKKAAQLALRGDIQSLATTHPGLWTMRHVAACMRDPRLITQVLSRCEHTRHL